MLKFKFLFICIGALSLVYLSISSKETEKVEPVITDPNAKSIYFRTWKNALKKDKTLQHIYDHLKTEQYGSYQKKLCPYKKDNPQQFEFFKNDDLLFVAWKNFDFPLPHMKKQSYLWLLESPVSIEIESVDRYKTYFNKIFTWRKAISDEKQTIYMPIPYTYENIKTDVSLKDKKALFSMVATNLTGHNYNLRAKVVIWFIKNHHYTLVFYGRGWNKIKSVLSPSEKEILKKSYKGWVHDKIDAISKTKFSFAFENIRFHDYVSEKIYDVMAANTVPVYSGAPNIQDYVPKECFIDYHSFKNNEEMYDVLSKMDDATYQSYINCINNFMQNPERHPNYYKNVANKILKHLELKK